LQMEKPLFVASARRAGGHGRALRRLVRLGAEALDPQRMPGPEAFGRLVREYSVPPHAAQLPLFETPTAEDEAP